MMILFEHVLCIVFCVVVSCKWDVCIFIGFPIIHWKKKYVFFSVGLRLCPFLEDHKEDILCGPVWLASGLDLSGHAGMLTLTSPKLVKGKVTYFIKAEWIIPE